MNIKDKILIHFNTNDISVYNLKDNTLKILDINYINFGDIVNYQIILLKINKFLNTLKEYTEIIDNEHIRIYATGIFRKFGQSEKDKLVNSIFVDYGIYFNIVEPTLEQFYLEKSMFIDGSENIMRGLLYQEFRNVVVCGSFQQFLQDIKGVIYNLNKHNIKVLSPASTNVKPETLGTNFILFDYQDYVKNDRDTWRHKFEHMDKFRQSDAIIVCNPDGFVGKGTIFEFGFMVANSKRIIFTEKPKDLSIFFPHEVGLNFNI